MQDLCLCYSQESCKDAYTECDVLVYVMELEINIPVSQSTGTAYLSPTTHKLCRHTPDYKYEPSFPSITYLSKTALAFRTFVS